MHSESKLLLKFRAEAAGLFKHNWKQWICLSSARPRWLNCSPTPTRGRCQAMLAQEKWSSAVTWDSFTFSVWKPGHGRWDFHGYITPSLCLYTWDMWRRGEGTKMIQEDLLLPIPTSLLNRSTSPLSQPSWHTDRYKMCLPAHTNANTLPIRASKQLAMAWRRSDSLQRSGPWA